MSPLHPDCMSVDERLAEIAEILALGLTRLHARKSSRLSGYLLAFSLGVVIVDFFPSL